MFTDYVKIYASAGKGGNRLEEKNIQQQVDQMVEMEEKVEMSTLKLIQIQIRFQNLDTKRNLKRKVEKMVKVLVNLEKVERIFI